MFYSGKAIFSVPLWFYFFFFCFLGRHLRHVKVPRLGVEMELQLLAYTTATATPDLSSICNLHHSLWQYLILNSLSEAKDQTHILMDTSQSHFRCATTGTPQTLFFRAVLGLQKNKQSTENSYVSPLTSVPPFTISAFLL